MDKKLKAYIFRMLATVLYIIVNRNFTSCFSRVYSYLVILFY